MKHKENTIFRFSDSLVKEYQTNMKKIYGAEISDDKAQSDLYTLSELYMIFTKTIPHGKVKK